MSTFTFRSITLLVSTAQGMELEQLFEEVLKESVGYNKNLCERVRDKLQSGRIACVGIKDDPDERYYIFIPSMNGHKVKIVDTYMENELEVLDTENLSKFFIDFKDEDLYLCR